MKPPVDTCESCGEALVLRDGVLVCITAMCPNEASYEAWLAETAKGCSQCSVCVGRRAEAASRGSVCDAMPCRCEPEDDDTSYDFYDHDSEDE